MSAAIWQDHGTFAGLAEVAHIPDPGTTELDIARRHQFDGEPVWLSPEQAPLPVREVRLGLSDVQRFARRLPKEIWLQAVYRDERNLRRKRVLLSLELRETYPPELVAQLERDLARLNNTLATLKRVYEQPDWLPRRWRVARWLRSLA